MKSIRLGVNIDHIATLRQVRGGKTSYPDIHALAHLAVRSGADQITVHLREDRRHIQPFDVEKLCQERFTTVNLEMAATPAMLKFALKNLPDWCCFVPEKRQELTTEGGLNVEKAQKIIGAMVEKLQSKGVETSMFIDPSLKQVKASHAVGADAVEFHTGKWVQLRGTAKKAEWKKLNEAAELASSLGLRVHAGHGLDFATTVEIKEMKHLEEVNIGHSIVCYSVEMGLGEVVKKMKDLLR
ncbi:MAG: pyridoxine 5'-phosphate synthase [Pseudobdellovibrionaceae bacterium]